MDGDSVDGTETTGSFNTYDRLIEYLSTADVQYRLIDHAPEGRTELASALRGHDLSDAAKCLIVKVKFGKRHARYVLAVIPGDARLDFTALKKLLSGTGVAFASTAMAEELAGTVSGSILPFSFHSELELIVDSRVLTAKELYFNAARLDRSIALSTDDYLRLTSPRIAQIAVLVSI